MADDYKDLSGVVQNKERLVCNITIAVTESRRDQWQHLREYFRKRNVNINVNLRRAISAELDQLQELVDQNT